MTRGRGADTAHLVAANIAEAREQWIVVFAHAAELAAGEAACYAEGRRLEEVLAACMRRASRAAVCGRVDLLGAAARHPALRRGARGRPRRRLSRLDAAHRQTAVATEKATQRAQASALDIADEAYRIRDALLAAWDGERTAARGAARVVLDGRDRLGLRRAAFTCAHDQLTDWADEAPARAR